jgi:uncharacterized protein YbcI
MERGPTDPGRQPPEREDPTDPIQDSERVAGTPSYAQIAENVADQLAQIHRKAYGAGAERVLSHLMDDTLIVLLDGLYLLPSEEFLVSKEEPESVLKVRSEFQKAIEPTFRAAVERATGRRVLSFTSHTVLENGARYSVEIFRLAPEDRP